MKVQRRWWCILVSTLALACGSVEPSSPAPELSATESPLLGRVTYSGCSASVTSMLQESMRWGRTAANSNALRQCLRRAFTSSVTAGGITTGPYLKCNGDPFYADPPDVQTARILDFLKTFNDVGQTCDPSTSAPGNAWTGIGYYENPNTETFSWNGPWLNDISASLSNPTCAEAPGTTLCRWAPYPWPYPQLGGISWHEVAHTHGYTHGANDQANAKVACGYASWSDAQWHFQRNTMPYVVEQCMAGVLSESASTCGDPRVGCGSRALRMVTDVGASTCECVADPGWEVIGGAASKVFVGGYGVFATYPGNGNILRYDGAPGAWTVVGGPGLTFAVNNVGLYGITPDGGAVMQYSGTPGVWTQIGTGATNLIAGGSALYAIQPGSGNIYRYNGTPGSWTFIGGPGDQFVANDTTLYARTVGSGAVMRFSGTPGTWTQIGGAARELIAGGSALFAIDPSTGNILRYDAGVWTPVGGPGRMFAANQRGLFGISTDGAAVYKLPTGSSSWVRVGGNLSGIYAAGTRVVGVHPSNDLLELLNP